MDNTARLGAWIFTALATFAVLLVTGILDVFLGLF